MRPSNMAHECTGICNNMLRYKSCIALGNGIDAATSAGGATTFGCGQNGAAAAAATGTAFGATTASLDEVHLRKQEAQLMQV